MQSGWVLPRPLHIFSEHPRAHAAPRNTKDTDAHKKCARSPVAKRDKPTIGVVANARKPLTSTRSPT
ncbi:MAG: hypothetical protein R3B67_09720 [Phycisphaerales bacterium]